MIQTLTVGQMAANCYIYNDIIIDPGDDAEFIMNHVSKPSLIIATHGHFDHIMGAFALQAAFQIPFVMNKKDEFLLENMQKNARHFLRIDYVDPPPHANQFVTDGDVVGGLRVLHTPGHTPGSICLVGDGFIFTGDTIFADGGVGRTDHSYSEPLKLATSLEKILSFDPSTRLLPGHGPETTIQERK